MKLIIISLLLICGIYQINCGVIMEAPDPNIQHNGYCYAHMGNLGELAKDESKLVPGHCYIAECKDDHSVIYRGCAPFQAQYYCQIVPGDPSKPFPQCCEQVKCGEKPKPIVITLSEKINEVDN